MTDRRRSGTIGMFYFRTYVSFCWTGSRVHSVNTDRKFERTTAGQLAGYRIDQWEDPIKWYYTLNGVANAAYRYTQAVTWSAGRPHAIQCTSTHTQRVYGTGRVRWAWKKDC